MQSTILRLPTVRKRTGKSRSTIYAEIKDGRFPSQIQIGKRSVGWIESEIDKHIQDQINKSRSDS